MRRHGVGRHGERIRDLAGGQAAGLVPHQQAEGFQPRRLGEGGEGENGGFRFHNSKIMEIYRRSIQMGSTSGDSRGQGRM
ncbi:hypothetical protein D3C77_377090 [compost metagenome]